MKSPRPTFLSRDRAGAYLNSPQRPPRQWPWGLLIVGTCLALLVGGVALALSAMK